MAAPEHQRIFCEESLTKSEILDLLERDTLNMKVSDSPEARRAREAKSLFRKIQALMMYGIPEPIIERLLYWPMPLLNATMAELGTLAAQGASKEALVIAAKIAADHGSVACTELPYEAIRKHPVVLAEQQLAAAKKCPPKPDEFDDGLTLLRLDVDWEDPEQR